MGLATIDPHSQKEHTEIHKIPKFGHPDGVRYSVRMPYISLLILTFLNRCISVKTSLINTKLGNPVNLGVPFLIMWINSC